MPEFKVTKNKLLSLFIDRMMVDKGVDGMSLGEQADLRKALAAELDTQIQSAMLEALPEEKLVELDKQLDGGMTDEELELFFEYSAGVDFQSVIKDAMERFRKAYLGETSEVAATEETAEVESEEEAESAVAPGILMTDVQGAF